MALTIMKDLQMDIFQSNYLCLLLQIKASLFVIN